MSHMLAWGPNLNIQDVDGNTPLHKAVQYVDDAETTRLVRFLILRGASTSIKNNKGELANDLVKNIETKKFAKDVSNLLGPPGKLDFLMLSTPVRKMKRNSYVLIFQTILILLIQTVEVLNIYPHLYLWQVGVNAFFALFMVFNLILAICRDPGYLKRETTTFSELIEVFDATHICQDCLTIRTSRSRHCYVCNRCVERYDHHCPWINNCVGVNNHNSFYLYVGSMVTLLLISLTQSFYTLVLLLRLGYAQMANDIPYLPRLPFIAFLVMITI